ncbi:hypothetical protein PGB90_010212 [Kerria lacca]
MNAIQTSRVIIPSVLVGILVLLYGCVVGWAANGIVNLQKSDSDIFLTKTESTLLAAFFELGRFSSAIPAGILGDKVGRKPIIYICSIQHLMAWSLKIFTTSKYVLFFARFISGTATGTGNAVLFIYAGEVAPAKIRGTVLSTLYTFFYLGILIQYILGTFLEYHSICIVSLAICSLFYIFLIFVKESPSYLITKSKYNEAKQIYKWVNSNKTEEEMNKEFEAMKEYVVNQRKSQERSNGGFSDPVNRKCVTLVFVINFLTQLTGLPAVVVFVHSVFANVNVLSPGIFSILFAAIQYIAGCSASLLSDKIGRRKMYMITCSLCVLSHSFTAVLHFLQDQVNVDIPHSSWLLLLSISVYACIYAAGLGPLTIIVRGELLPQAVKGIGSGLAVVSAGVSCFLLIFIFHVIENSVGLAYNFIFFIINCLLLMTLVYFKLPETKHKTLAEIHAAFKDSI